VRYFETQRAKREHFSQMLARYPLGIPIPPPDDDDLRDLIELHPDANEKIGVGIDYFFVEQNPPCGSRGFQILRVDGSVVRFSYPACLTGRRASAEEEVNHALRREIGDDIQRAKIECFEATAINGRITCPETGRACMWDEVHADHADPYRFVVLTQTFLVAHGITPGYEMVEKFNGVSRLKDRRLAEEWSRFHHRLANIRMVHKEWNRKDGVNSKTKSGAFLKLVAENA
jgi:Protein of unknown function (DUF3223)